MKSDEFFNRVPIPVSLSCQSQSFQVAHASEKPVNVVSGGRTVLAATIKDPQNQILVHTGYNVFPALVDTGSSISVSSLCGRLRKVILLPQGPILKSAINTISIPIVSETSRLFISCVFVLFSFTCG